MSSSTDNLTKDSKTSDATFSGTITEWFRFDMNMINRSREIHGQLGEDLWNQIQHKVTDHNLDEQHDKIMESILEAVGPKDYQFYEKRVGFKNPEKLNHYLSNIVRKIVGAVKSYCKDRALKYVNDLDTTRLWSIRALLMEKNCCC